MYFLGFEPDFLVRQEIKFSNGVLDLRQFDKILIALSGGKDSHAMLFFMKELAEKQGVFDRLLAMYADTGMEWHSAEAHVRKLCVSANIPLQIVYPVRPMIEQIKYMGQRFLDKGQKRRDGKPNRGVLFPSARCRYCTSAQKVEVKND